MQNEIRNSAELRFKANIADPDCPSRQVLDLLSDKWTGLVVLTLAGETKRYSQLKREVGGISHKMLSETLRELERKRLVKRVVYDSIPPQVEYSLTSLGQTLLTPLNAIIEWAEEHIYEMGMVNLVEAGVYGAD